MIMNEHTEKIRKLLRLSKSANEHEARLALQRAMELATAHGVDIEALRDDPEVGGIVHEWFPMKSRLSREWKQTIYLVQQFFNVRVCIAPHERRMVFIGRRDAIEVADYVAQFLVRRCRSEAAAYKAAEIKARRRMTGGKRAAFIVGFFSALYVHLDVSLRAMMAQEESWAIVLADEKAARNAYLDGLLNHSTVQGREKKVRSGGALIAGYRAGKNTQIHKPLTGDEVKPAMPQPRFMLES
jgi:hypothetical protein